jgi:glyoxylase-like metal-dependent hydrolase (beta-lactamase superfamily II)
LNDTAQTLEVVHLSDGIVTALPLGSFTARYELLDGMTATAAVEYLRTRGRPVDGLVHAHAFVVRTADHTLMIDAGMGADSPLPGLATALAAAGVDRSAVDTVLLTHLHPDHANGLLDGDFADAVVVVPDAEIAFARDSAAIEAAGPFMQRDYARAGEVLDALGERLTPLTAWESVPGLRAEALPGHSPGHTGYRIGDHGRQVLCVGDLLHFPDLQVARPDVSVRPDLDPRLAALTRRQVLSQAADRGTILAGAHFGSRPFRRIHRSASGLFAATRP